jgi:hypothetical protein
MFGLKAPADRKRQGARSNVQPITMGFPEHGDFVMLSVLRKAAAEKFAVCAA